MPIRIDIGAWPGLIWGFDFADGEMLPVSDPQHPPRGTLRWLHLSLADQRAQLWIAEHAPLPAAARELLLSTDEHQRAWLGDNGLSENGLAFVLHDFIRELEDATPVQTGALHVALTPGLLISARYHPLRCADLFRARLDAGARPVDGPAALDLLVSAVVTVASQAGTVLTAEIQQIEDALLDTGREPGARQVPLLRRRTVSLHRQLGGLHRVFHRLDEDEDLPEALQPIVAKLVQRIAAVESDIVGIHDQTRQLREELDLRATQRTNRNLYVLSIMTALLLPATLVTGIFGMNTGGLPFTAAPHGTILACLIALASALGAYMMLRMLGFFRDAGG